MTSLMTLLNELEPLYIDEEATSDPSFSFRLLMNWLKYWVSFVTAKFFADDLKIFAEVLTNIDIDNLQLALDRLVTCYLLLVTDSGRWPLSHQSQRSANRHNRAISGPFQ